MLLAVWVFFFFLSFAKRDEEEIFVPGVYRRLPSMVEATFGLEKSDETTWVHWRQPPLKTREKIGGASLKKDSVISSSNIKRRGQLLFFPLLGPKRRCQAKISTPEHGHPLFFLFPFRSLSSFVSFVKKKRRVKMCFWKVHTRNWHRVDQLFVFLYSPLERRLIEKEGKNRNEMRLLCWRAEDGKIRALWNVTGVCQELEGRDFLARLSRVQRRFPSNAQMMIAFQSAL